MIQSYREILLRDLDLLRFEIEAFASDKDLWRVLPGTVNPPGVLALHLCGNLQHFIGATLGASGYVRDRDAEFAARSEEHTSELQSRLHLVCRLLLEKKKKNEKRKTNI